MASKCELCGKTSISGNKVSHSNRKSKKKWAPNIQKVKISLNDSQKKMNVCTKCLKSGEKTK